MKIVKIIFPILILFISSISISSCSEDEVLTKVDGDEQPAIPEED